MAFEPVADDTTAQKFSEHLKALVGRFSSKAKGDDERFGAVTEALEAVSEQFGVQAAAQAATAKALDELLGKFTKLEAAHAELVKQLDNTDSQRHQRQAVTVDLRRLLEGHPQRANGVLARQDAGGGHAQQLGHVDVTMVFQTYGKFISTDYQRPRLQLVQAA